jgi:hypothetical protein
MPWFEMNCGCKYWNDGFVVKEFCKCGEEE